MWVSGARLRVQGPEFRLQSFGFWVWVEGAGCRVQGCGFRIQNSGFGVRM